MNWKKYRLDIGKLQIEQD